jgi:hypothetical protein
MKYGIVFIDMIILILFGWYLIVKAMEHRRIRDLGSEANYFSNLIMVNDILKQW